MLHGWFVGLSNYIQLFNNSCCCTPFHPSKNPGNFSSTVFLKYGQLNFSISWVLIAEAPRSIQRFPSNPSHHHMWQSVAFANHCNDRQMHCWSRIIGEFKIFTSCSIPLTRTTLKLFKQLRAICF